ncbi:YciI family protein [Siphonobacter aquaeclarae]|uniref:YCII-related domain-containing protein n=1 Tax=Siphonobacter aquaeclarae TaxID=563176 RepID=A0A1G9U5M0_9BACT|nr:YciI family protein [Siphonobacter aquaeclarae]SDM55246.1 YCII-related domain-containing protein [Siphonobacter aquaeclarae]
MKTFLILFREPDGRTDEHSEAFTQTHQQHWQTWLQALRASEKLVHGGSLTMDGKVIKDPSLPAEDGPLFHGLEFVGGFLLIREENLETATALLRSCPIFESDGWAEIRELQYS